MRWFPRSATKEFRAASVATSAGELNCPLPLPALPHCETNRPGLSRASTVWMNAAELPARKLPSPTYETVRACDPAPGASGAVTDAVPTLSVAPPSAVAPSKKLTLPVGTPAPGGAPLSVTPIVTGWPSPDGLGSVVRANAGEALLTTCAIGGDTLAARSGPPS